MSDAAPGPPSSAGQGVPFRLVPWGVGAAHPPLPELSVTGSMTRQGRDLAVRFLVRGPIDQLALPAPEPPARRDELWRRTCLEFFLAPRGAEAYWEFNLSPAGHWNVYRFRGYRRGMAEETGYSTLPFLVRQGADALSLDLGCPLPEPLEPHRPVEVAVCAVIAPRRGEVSYWALAHPGEAPDFHLREGFRLRI